MKSRRAVQSASVRKGGNERCVSTSAGGTAARLSIDGAAETEESGMDMMGAPAARMTSPRAAEITTKPGRMDMRCCLHVNLNYQAAASVTDCRVNVKRLFHP